jgi:hypothetical protein
MTILRLFELAMSAVTLVSGWLVGNKNVWGQRLSLLANIMWWVYILWTKAWGLVPMEIGFSIIVFRAWRMWEQDARRRQ